MTQRKWPAHESAAGPTDHAAESSGSAKGRGRHHLNRFICYTIFFLVLAGLFRSWFPLALGALLLVYNDEFIAWVLGKIGIRLIPGTLGPPFVSALVVLAGLAVFDVYWKDSEPAWLASGSPPAWPLIDVLIVAGALCVAALQLFTTAAAKRLFPRAGTSALVEGVFGFAIFGLLFVLIFAISRL